MGANLILPAGSAAAADSTPADPVTRSLRFNDADNSHLYFDPTATYDSETVYTFSCWAKLGELSNSSSQNIFSAGYYSSSSNQKFLLFRILSDRTISVRLRNNSDNTSYSSTALLRDPSAWSHLLLVRNGASLKVYVNNTEVISQTISATQMYGIGSSYPMHIGASLKPTSSGISNYDSFDGLLADVYFTDGYAKSPTDFIELGDYGNYIPKAYTGEFGTNGFHIDAQLAHDADLLVTSVGRNDGDTTFVDAAKGHTITTTGDPEHSIKVGNPFTGDGRAIYFDGTDDYLTVSNHSDLTPSTGDFTVEAWINYSSIPNSSYGSVIYGVCGGAGGPSGDSLAFMLKPNGHLGLIYGDAHYTGSSATAMSSGTWYHVALVRSSGTVKLYIDGDEDYSATHSGNLNVTTDNRIGARGGTPMYFDGYIYDLRFSGAAKYTSSFTPPTSKLTDESDTELLIQPDKDDTDFHDETSTGHTISATGSPTRKASTPYDAAAKSTAMYFDGTGDRVMANHSSDFNFGTGAFTIEMWHKHISSVNGSSGSSNITGDIVISKGKWHTSTTGWLLKTVAYGTDVLDFDMYMGDGSFSNQVNLSANSSGVSTVHDGDWHHIAITRDGSGNMGLFVDGTRVADDTGTGYDFDATSYGLRIGAVYGYDNAESNYANCYLYDVRVTKGEAKYDPTSSSVTKPSAPFELNPVYIGGDQSGNKNHFTPTNISQAHDVMLDVPTKNYAVLNPLQKAGTNGSDPSEGNLSLTGGSSPSKAFSSTIAVNSGKYYAEFHIEALGYPTVAVGDTSLWVDGYGSGRIQGNGVVAYDIRAASTTGQYFINSTSSSGDAGISPATDDIIQVAFDADTRKVWFGRNGTWNNSGNPANGTNEIGTANGTDALTLLLRSETSSGSGTTVANYGQDPTFAGGASSRSDSPDTSQGEFYFAPPTGFKSLNSSNLDAPVVTPEENFEALTYAGSGSNRDITGLDFQPDLVWIKDRTTGGSGGFHCIHDSVRGDDGTHKYILSSDNTITTDTTYSGYGVTSFNSDGFSIINGGSLTNDSSRNYVAWNWKAHQSPSSGPTTTYTVKVEDNSGDAWDYSGSYYDSSTYLPSVYMEIFENRNSSLVSLGKVAVRTYDSSGSYISEQSEQTYTLECADLDAIAVKWHYDTSGDGQQYDSPNSYNDYLNDQKITILDGTTSEWTTNNYSNADGTSYNYSPPTGWANGDTLKSATTSYNGSNTATLTSGGSSGPTEKYNAAAGFTIISYAGDGSTDGDTQTLDHSLGVPLEFVIAKARTSNDSYDTGNWIVWHKDLASSKYLYLNSSSAQRTEASGYNLISTATSGTQHQVQVNNGSDNSSYNYHYLNSGPDNGTGEDYILYGWASAEGMVKVGSWVGNGDDDGPMVYCGFRPSLILAKAVNRSNSWYMWDDQRDGYNVTDAGLWADLSNAESHASTNKIDILSNGFKLRGSGNGTNSSSSNNYIFIAWAHSPFSKANSF